MCIRDRVQSLRIAYETMLAEFERVLTKYGFSPKRAHEAAEIFAQNSLAGMAMFVDPDNGKNILWAAVGLVISVVAVSYTHLDVYKRQVSGYPKIESEISFLRTSRRISPLQNS